MVQELEAQNLLPVNTDSDIGPSRCGFRRRAVSVSPIIAALCFVLLAATAAWRGTSSGFHAGIQDSVGLSGEVTGDDTSKATVGNVAGDDAGKESVRETIVSAQAPGDGTGKEEPAACRRDGSEFVQKPAEDCVGCTVRHGGITPAAYECALAVQEEAQLKIGWFGEVVKKHTPGAVIIDEGFGDELPSDASKGWSMFNSLNNHGTDYTHFPLAGSRFTVDVDLGNPGASCGCNVALFFISAPAAKKSEWGNYYCDANCVGGNCCAEFDLMEMNVHSLLVTSHTCTDYQKPPFNSQPWNCDHGGTPQISFGNGKMDFGPGPRFTIDSTKKFQYRIEFPEEAGILRAVVTLSQGQAQVSGRMENLESMRKALTDGMALDADSWFAEDLVWLDGAVCSLPERCNRKSAIFDRISIERLESSASAPAPGSEPGVGQAPSNEEAHAPAHAPAPAAGPDSDKAPASAHAPPPAAGRSPAPEAAPSAPTPAKKSCPRVPEGWDGYCAWINSAGCDNVPDDASLFWCRCCCEEVEAECKWAE